MNKSPKNRRVVSLYGVALCIPPAWIDRTEYVFVGPGPILKLIWTLEPLPSSDLDEQLGAYRDNLAEYLGPAHVSDLRDYAHPRWRVRGFQANTSGSPTGP